MKLRTPRVCDDCRYVTCDFKNRCPHCNFVCTYQNHLSHIYYVKELPAGFFVMCGINGKPHIYKSLQPKRHFIEAQSQLNQFAISHGFTKVQNERKEISEGGTC